MPIRAMAELIRWKNGVLAAASVLAAAFVATGSSPFRGPILIGAAVVLAVLGAGNALNDYFDEEIDRRNAPGRPIPSGRISPAAAIAASIALFAAGNAAAVFFLPARSLPYPIANTVLLALYGRYSKRIAALPNLAVAWISASVFLFTGSILGARSASLYVLAAGAFLTTLSREIFKDIEDVPGDSLVSARTLPLALGPGAAATLARAPLVPAAGLLILPPAAGWTHAVYAVFGVPALAALAAGFFSRRPGPSAPSNWRWPSSSPLSSRDRFKSGAKILDHERGQVRELP